MYSLVTTVNHTVLYTWNLVRGNSYILHILTVNMCAHTHEDNYGRWWICQLALLWWLFHNVYEYQNMKLYTLNTHNCLLAIPQ